MKNRIALIVLILIVASTSPSFGDTEGMGMLRKVGSMVVGVNVLTVTMNGIFSYTDPPRHGPILLGVVWGTGSAILGSFFMSNSTIDHEPEIFGWGLAMTATGVASIALAFINSDKVSNHIRKAPVSPEVSLNLEATQSFRMGIKVDF